MMKFTATIGLLYFLVLNSPQTAYARLGVKGETKDDDGLTRRMKKSGKGHYPTMSQAPSTEPSLSINPTVTQYSCTDLARYYTCDIDSVAICYKHDSHYHNKCVNVEDGDIKDKVPGVDMYKDKYELLNCGCCPEDHTFVKDNIVENVEVKYPKSYKEEDGYCDLISASPSKQPSAVPSTPPSAAPSTTPSTTPSKLPSASPSTQPSTAPSTAPSTSPSASVAPSIVPSTSPSAVPSKVPSASVVPSIVPSTSPSASIAPSTVPSMSPSASIAPSASPTVICPCNVAGTFFGQLVAGALTYDPDAPVSMRGRCLRTASGDTYFIIIGNSGYAAAGDGFSLGAGTTNYVCASNKNGFDVPITTISPAETVVCSNLLHDVLVASGVTPETQCLVLRQ